MENDIKKKDRKQTPQTKEKISNTQRMRFAKMKRAIKENELRKLEPTIVKDTVPLDDNDMWLELRFQVQDEFDLLMDAMFQLFRHQLKMEAKSMNSNDRIDGLMAKANADAIIDQTIKDYMNNNLIKNEDD